jgi:hypothetical protein
MRRSWSALAAGVIALQCTETATAMPVFARRYGVECHMCHQGFPKLNKTGHRFKERGYRLENEDPFKASDWIKSIPLRARASGTRLFFEDGGSFDSAFVKLISAGHLGPRLSYWVDSGLLFDDNAVSDVYREPTDAWARVELVSQGKLYLRAGRMELDLPFTQVRTPHLFSYAPYSMNSGREADNIADDHHAVEVGGTLGEGKYHWSAAVTSGAEDPASAAVYQAAGLDDESGAFEANLFLRASRRGDRNRYGAFTYVGRSTLAVAPAIGKPATWQDDLWRVGLDADLWPLTRLNVYGLYMYGRNGDSVPDRLGAGGSGAAATFQGAFVQADYHAVDKAMDGFLKEIALAATLRGHWTRVPAPGLGPRQSAWSVYPGVQLWLRERFRLAFEYGFEAQGRKDLGAVQAELVF